ncbi:MAG: TIGR03758 family integrating conjugative element protein, partial [Gammaproteobacteria bacterium]|nr:TIGR03758 family integrating conjugative element protein [Gammaproteobacteria bacterium]
MNQTQLNAFQGGAGVAAADLTLVIAGVTAMLLLLWVAWVGLAQLKLWQSNQATLYDLTWNIVRATIIALLLGY